MRGGKAERDRALEATRNAEARINEMCAQARKLSAGALVIVRWGDRYELLPRPTADKVRERDARLVVLGHGQPAGTGPAASSSEYDAYYARFKVPHDLVW